MMQIHWPKGETLVAHITLRLYAYISSGLATRLAVTGWAVLIQQVMGHQLFESINKDTTLKSWQPAKYPVWFEVDGPQ